MLSYLRKTRETGFTLIELLTVIIIIGILAAVAIPVFTSQRGRAQDSQTISDVRNVVTAAETLLADRTKSVSDLSQSSVEFVSSKNVLWNIKGNTTTNGYCIAAYNASGKDYNSSTSLLTYDSTGGGLKKNGSSCAGIDVANNSNTPVPTSSTASGTVAVSNDPRVAYSASLADNPVAFYSLSEANGTTNVTDLSANNNTGTTVSNVTFGAAGPNGAITGASFNGANPSYVSLPVGSSVGSGSFTIESWVKVSSINNNFQTIYERGTVGVNGYVFYVRNGYVGLGTNAAYNTTTTQLTPNTWYHVAVVYNGSTANFYVNGVSTQNITSSPSNYTSPSNSVRIGSHSNGSEAFTGSIAGVGVYNSTLSGTQIANHYNSSK